jgi:hypothetical protein
MAVLVGNLSTVVAREEVFESDEEDAIVSVGPS